MGEAHRDPNADAFTLAVLMQHAGKLLDDRLRVGFEQFGLHPSQGRVLHLLVRKDRVEQRALAEMMNVSAPTMSGVLKRMEAEELIERSSDSARHIHEAVPPVRPNRALVRNDGRIQAEAGL